MDAQATAPFLRFFKDLKDPRRHNVRHVFTDILTIAILAVLCRADDWDEVVLWAEAEAGFLRTILALPHGIPCPDTFARVFARIDPAAFERCFIDWTAALAGSLRGEVVAIDGKALRRSFQHAWDKQMIHLVSAWAAGNQLVLGQLAVDDKSNEITAIPKLLALLDLAGATVTIDAMGCQREVAAAIVDKGADYVLAVKENQPTLAAKVAGLLDEAVLDKFDGMSHGCFEETCGGHGRIETRRVWVTDEVKWLGKELLALWPGLASLAVVEATRQVIGGKRSVERRYYISSRTGASTGTDAAAMAAAIRGHWGVENRLHWQLDVTFGEDDSRLRTGDGAENFSRLRRLTLNLLKKAPGKKRQSLKRKRYQCSLDRKYLLTVLSQ
jgi:predicted transposase YbfD/YdcC